MKKRIKQVVVASDPGWGKWPHTDDTDFTGFFDKVWETKYEDIIVENHLLPISLAYRKIGFAQKPPGFPGINNTKAHPPGVTDEQKLLLDHFAGFDSILWEHTHQCHPEVASTLPERFPLRIIAFGDDCPGSSELKTFPVCKWFNALYHSMMTWSFQGGENVGEMYRQRGLDRTYFKASTESAGLFPRMQEMDFDVYRKIDVVARGERLPIDMVFVGHFGGHQWRFRLLKKSSMTVPSGMEVRYYGVNAPHGTLEPRTPPQGMGYTLPPVYANALFGVNPQMSSLFNTRLMDLWLMGVAQVIYDPHQELVRQGFEPGVHYVSFNGSAEHLWEQIMSWGARPSDLAAMLRRAHERCVEYMGENSVSSVYAKIYREGLGL